MRWLISCLFLMSCAASSGTDMPALGGANASTCDAPSFVFMIGEPRSFLSGLDFERPVRIIDPGMAVTQDFNPQRLNFDIDGNGRISRVSCG